MFAFLPVQVIKGTEVSALVPKVLEIQQGSVQLLSHVCLYVAPSILAHTIALSVGSPRQEYWSELPFPSPGDLPNARIEPGSPALQADALPSEPPGILTLYLFFHTTKVLEKLGQ